MGVLYDYYRAPDRQVALRLLNGGDGVPGGPTTVKADIDAIDAKGIEYGLILGKLVAFILDVPWTVDLVGTAMVWPPEETKPASVEEYERLPEDSPWNTGPWVVELNDRVRDALAGVDDDLLPSLAEQWAGIEEFRGTFHKETALGISKALVALARRARQADDRLYCWCCL